MASNLNITRTRGDTRRLIMQIMKPNSVEPQPIAGWSSFSLGIDTRQFPDNTSTNIATITGTLLSDGSDGQLYFIFPSTIPAGSYYYDAQATDSNGEIYTFVKGSIIIEQDITK